MNRKRVVNAFRKAGVNPDDRLLIACSGGVDSVVLVHLVREMHYEFALAHVNHHTRGAASDGDEAFVRELALVMGVPFYRRDFEHRGEGNFQNEARTFRYRWLQYLSEMHNYRWVCTAHHLDDQRETFLQKILRGAGAQSLQGIRLTLGNRLRPLLGVPKRELLTYARENHISWRTDASNDSIAYERNYVRSILLPHVAAMHPRALKGLDVTMGHLAAQSMRLEELLTWWRGKCMRQLPGMLEVDPEVLPPGGARADWLREVLLPWGHFDTQMILDKADSGESAQCVRGKHALATSLARIFLTSAVDPEEKAFHGIGEELRLNGQQRLVRAESDCLQALNSISLPVHMLSRLVVRTPRQGDRIAFGEGNHKKLSDFLLEQRIPQPMRQRMIWLICDSETVLWIPRLYCNQHYSSKGEESCDITFFSPLF